MAALRRRRAPHDAPAPPPHPFATLRVVARAGWRPLFALARDLLEFALPQRCPGCGEPAAPERLLCPGCFARLPRLEVALCVRCLRDERPADGCRLHPGDRVHAAFVYDERVALLVHALKFGARPRLARACARALAGTLPRTARRPAFVTAVPLHPTRLRERGYDQAGCLAEALADQLAVPFVPGVLARTRATRAQSGLGARARRRNVRGAFRVEHPAWVRDHDVLVVDDVLTTGATLHEVLRTLRSAGARTSGVALAWAQ